MDCRSSTGLACAGFGVRKVRLIGDLECKVSSSGTSIGGMELQRHISGLVASLGCRGNYFR